jgi:hypothetical protein
VAREPLIALGSPERDSTGDNRMRIHFEQSGGLVAGVRRLPVTIDTATLAGDEAKKWHDLVTGADFFNLPTTISPGAARDAFSYLVTVESESKRHTIQTQSGCVPARLSPLIERLREAGRSRTR